MTNEEVKTMKELAKKLRLACWESKCDDCPFLIDRKYRVPRCMFNKGRIPSDWVIDDKEEDDEDSD